MGKRLSTYHKDDQYCEIHIDLKQEEFYIKYFDKNGKNYFIEEFPNKSLHYVQDAAENWTLGIKSVPTKENVV